MGFYINDIVSFSLKGFEYFDIEFIRNEKIETITDVSTKYTEGKGLKYVPKQAKMMNNVVAELISRNELYNSIDNIGLYNSNDICSLEASIDFDLEVKKYGTKLANPMKVPYTLGGALGGFLAIRNKMHNTNLTVNCGRCGLIPSLNMIGLDFEEEDTDFAIALDAHYMGPYYDKYNSGTKCNKEFCIGALLSKERTCKSFAEIVETKSKVYSKNEILKLIGETEGYTIIVDDYQGSAKTVKNIGNIHIIDCYSRQMSMFLPYIRQSVRYFEDSFNRLYNYIVIDEEGFYGYIKYNII